MSDLSVTDVQRILREHAEHGHDILKDPRTVYFTDPHEPTSEPAPFGMPLETSLFIKKNASASLLRTTVMHGERPTGTVVGSWVDHLPSGSNLRNRDAIKIHPSYEDNVSRFTSFPAPHEDGTNQTENDYSWDAKPAKFNQNVGQLHVALRKQASSPALYTFEGKAYSTHHNTGDWNLQEALQRQAEPLKPFSGLVHVTSGNWSDGVTTWAYNPSTEQLHKLS